MRNVLFIVYYFPPMGSSGVQRPLKFVKYLREFGWNPVILAPEAGAYHTFDQSLWEEFLRMDLPIHRVKAKTPFHRMKKGAGLVHYLPDSLKTKIRSISQLFMLPDNKRGWVDPAVQEGVKVARKQNIDLVFSTAPPYSNHLAGVQLKKKLGVPLVLDFRDDWLESHLINYLFPFQKRRMRQYELECLEAADAGVAINSYMLNSLSSRDRSGTVFREIPQGFDPPDFDEQQQGTLQHQPGKFNLLYSGIFYNENQPDAFLEAVRSLMDADELFAEQIVLHFQGRLEMRHQKLIDTLGLQDRVHYYGYLPHATAAANLMQADALWMIARFYRNPEQVTTGKLYEYIGTGKPILGLVGAGAARELLNQYGPGYAAEPDRPGDIIDRLKKMWGMWNKGTLPEVQKRLTDRYTRRRLTERLSDLFDKIVTI